VHHFAAQQTKIFLPSPPPVAIASALHYGRAGTMVSGGGEALSRWEPERRFGQTHKKQLFYPQILAENRKVFFFHCFRFRADFSSIRQ
jgi:hypothetical protein